ncbi:MAG: hypothetical protein IT355_00590 [Gemmatimonadaceae bacterium]|nr:hypothetical protein [Gemmatimonadaceae bacterium]
MTPHLRGLTLTAALMLVPAAAQAQAATAPCVARDTASLTGQARALLTRAARDPIVGCAALDATHRTGDVVVGRADTIRGNLVVLDGTLRVTGTVTGSAIALNGAVLIDTSGHVLGDVIAAEHGAAIAALGRVDGELRTLDSVQPAEVLVTQSAVGGTLSSLKQTAAWFGILILLAVGVLTNAGDAMQRITTTLQAGFARNVMVGGLAQLALLPVLLVICLLLGLTLLGILLIPFAIVAYVIAVLGLLVLGGLSAVQMVGTGIARRRPGLSDRAARLQALVTGMLLLSLPWLAAASLAASPIASAWVRTFALGLTWVAVTAGLGAALRTRAGTRAHTDPWGIRRPAPSGTPLPIEPPQAEWLTPTPLTGVVAVKRPTSGTGAGSAR